MATIWAMLHVALKTLEYREIAGVEMLLKPPLLT